ncbi:hypothetical protein JCM33374_g5410 [Metschnikowia sp. JCM 33374]|nr:hypothetical protein JCM33374_g5410 [Metschnikowia sp. JCM 33374]
MISRVGLRAPRATRNFQTSAVTMNSVYGSPKTGIYSNLPFKVKDRKIPFGIVWWGTYGLFFAFPFLTAYWHLKKSGSLA